MRICAFHAAQRNEEGLAASRRDVVVVAGVRWAQLGQKSTWRAEGKVGGVGVKELGRRGVNASRQLKKTEARAVTSLGCA
eukprot:6183236-Pleurochrysis_carterae.AAC.1